MINATYHTGFLKEAASLYQRGGDGQILFFILWVRDDRSGEDVPHKYRIEDAALIARYRGQLTPGRCMTVQGKTRMVPVIRHGVTKFETLGLEAQHIDLHGRVPRPVAEAATASVQADPEPGPVEPGDSPLKRVLEQLLEDSGGEDTAGDDSSMGDHERRREAALGVQAPPAANVPEDAYPPY